MECNCTMREKLVGDGCEACNPAKDLEYAKGTIEDTEESLRRALVVIRQMYDAFWGTSEIPGQDEANEAAKEILIEFDA